MGETLVCYGPGAKMTRGSSHRGTLAAHSSPSWRRAAYSLALVVVSVGGTLAITTGSAVAAGTPATIVAVPTTTPQSAQEDRCCGHQSGFTPLQALVLDNSGQPVSGVTVTFKVPGSGPSVDGWNNDEDVETTDAQGIAESARPEANGTTGSYTVTASAPGVATPAQFSLTNLSETPDRLTASLISAPQSAEINTPFVTGLEATFTNPSSQPLSSVPVTFTVFDATDSGSGYSGQASATFAGGLTQVIESTNPEGVATTPALTANGATGTYVVTASAAGAYAPVSFLMTNLSSQPGSILALPQTTPQSEQNGSGGFPRPLEAYVLDSAGQPASGASVTFADPSTNPTADLNPGCITQTEFSVTVVASANGIASLEPTNRQCYWGTTVGSFDVVAYAPGVAAPAEFSLSNTSNTPDTFTASSTSTPQTAVPGASFATLLRATLTNSQEQPVGGVRVTFTVYNSLDSGFGGDASASFPGGVSEVTTTTGPEGVAIAPAPIANGSTGSYVVVASVPGAFAPAVFELTNAIPVPPNSGGGGTAPTSTTTGGVVKGGTTVVSAATINKLKVSSHKVSGHMIALVLQAPSAGTITVSGNDITTVKRKIKKGGKVTLRIALSRAGLASLKKHHNKLAVKFKVAFKPSRGSSSFAVVAVTVK